MAKQIINTGLTANDGTGDPIRTAMIKVNANFTELYNANANTFSGSYADLTNKPAIPTDLTDLGIADGTVGQILTTDGAGGFTFEDAAGAGGGIALTALSVGSEPAASGNGNLAYNANTGVFTYTPPVIPADLADLGITDGTVGQVLTTDGSGTFTFATVGGALQSRTTKAGTTASLANNARGDLNITGFKGYALLAIQTDKAAWVRIYANAATRSADASRLESVDPTPDAGVIAEVITTGAQTVLVSPSIIGYNLESPVTTTIPCSVTNKSGSTGTVTVTLTVLQLEA
jgi:hypothetical protein